jgi:hypothetical protein
MVRTKWEACLEQGLYYERELLKYIKYDSYETSEDKGLFLDWDIKTLYNNKEETYEVKSDEISSRTGNICVEYASSGKPSGITSTKADYWVNFSLFPTRYELHIIPIDILREMIKNKQYVRSCKGGTGMRSEMYLISKASLAGYKINIPSKCLIQL